MQLPSRLMFESDGERRGINRLILDQMPHTSQPAVRRRTHELTPEVIRDIREAAASLTGFARRSFKAEICEVHGLSAAKAKNLFKWRFDATKIAIEERRTGKQRIAMARRFDERHPEIVTKIKEIINTHNSISGAGILRALRADTTLPKEALPKHLPMLYAILKRMRLRQRITWESIDA